MAWLSPPTNIFHHPFQSQEARRDIICELIMTLIIKCRYAPLREEVKHTSWNRKNPSEGTQERAGKATATWHPGLWWLHCNRNPLTGRALSKMLILIKVSAEWNGCMWLIHLNECNPAIFQINISIHAAPWKTPYRLLSFQQPCIPIVRHLKDKELCLPSYLPALWTINNICVSKQFCSDCRNKEAVLWPSLHLWKIQSE